jgi:hypothetical protein
MPDLIKVTYDQTGASKKTNEPGMREMQLMHKRVYKQYIS